MEGRQSRIGLRHELAVDRFRHVVGEQRVRQRIREVTHFGVELFGENLGVQRGAEGALVFLPGGPERVEHLLAVVAIGGLAIFSIRRLVEAFDLGAVAQGDGRERQLAVRKLAIDVVRLRQHVARRRHDAFRLRAERVRFGAQHVVQEEAEAALKFGGLLLEGLHLVGTDFQDRGRQPRRFLAQGCAKGLRQLQPFLVGSDPHVFVALQ